MSKARAEGFLRLGIGTVLNIVLWQIVGKTLGRGGAVTYDFQRALLATILGAPALVSVIPVFWRGEPWQAPLAFVLIPLPLLSLLVALSFATTN